MYASPLLGPLPPNACTAASMQHEHGLSGLNAGVPYVTDTTAAILLPKTGKCRGRSMAPACPPLPQHRERAGAHTDSQHSVLSAQHVVLWLQKHACHGQTQHKQVQQAHAPSNQEALAAGSMSVRYNRGPLELCRPSAHQQVLHHGCGASVPVEH